MSADFQIKLTAEGKKFLKELEELTKLEVAVGYQEDAKYPEKEGGQSIAEVAIYNDLGTIHSESRPFMRDSLNCHKQEIECYMQKQAKALVDGKESTEEVLKKVGVYQKKLIQREITHGNFKENKKATKARKGSDTPLIDTGIMRQSVNFVVRKKGSSD